MSKSTVFSNLLIGSMIWKVDAEKIEEKLKIKKLLRLKMLQSFTYFEAIVLCTATSNIQCATDEVVLNVNDKECIHWTNNLNLNRVFQKSFFFIVNCN